MNVKPIPEGMNMITPHLVVKNGDKAIEFYKRAFMAQEMHRMTMPGSKKIMHACIQIAGQNIFLCDEMKGAKAPKNGGSGMHLHLYVGDADKVFYRAIEHGAKQMMPLENTFWGDRYGMIVDPFGHTWAIATHVEDVTPEEMKRRGEKMMAGVK